MAKTTVFYDLRALIRQAIVEVYDTDFKGLSYTEVWELTGEAENLAGLLKDWGDIERMRGSANQWKNVERQDDGA